MVWRKLKVWPLWGRYIVSYNLLTLFFSLNLSCCSLHSFCSTKRPLSDRPARSGCSHIPWGFVLHHSSDSPRALSVSEGRKTLIPWRQVKLGRGSPFLTAHSSSVNLLHVIFANRAWMCGKVWLPVFSNREPASHKKWFFSKTNVSFLQAIFYDVTSDPRQNVWGGLGQRFEIFFFDLF